MDLHEFHEFTIHRSNKYRPFGYYKHFVEKNQYGDRKGF